MDIYWITSLYFREILFCKYEIFENDLKSLFIMLRVHFKLMKMGIPADKLRSVRSKVSISHTKWILSWKSR